MTLFFIFSAELMIQWNEVSGVSSLANVGQLIAFLVGVGGVLSVILGWQPGEKGGSEEARQRGGPKHGV